MRANELGEPRGTTSLWFNTDRPDLLVEVFSEGQWSAVKVTHIESGKSIISTFFKSRMQNKLAAIEVLDAVLSSN